MTGPVVLFDAMGTLLELRDPVGRLRAALASRVGMHTSEPEARQALRAEITHYRANLWRGRDPQALARLRAECAEVLRAALGPAPALAALSAPAMIDLLLDALHFEPFPDAVAALHDAREAGIPTVVVSNWDCSLPEVLERTGLLGLVDAVVTSAEAGVAKPEPEIFRRALGLVGAQPDQAVHVGDSVAEDVAGARAAGIEPILVRRSGAMAERPEGVRTVAALTEIAELRGG